MSGTAATVTGAAQSNITSVGTLTGLTIGGDLTLDSAGAVVYDKSLKSLTFGDKHFIKFGTGGDANIRHDGNNTKFTHGCGWITYTLQILLHFKMEHMTKTLLLCQTMIELYEDNVKRLETSVYGVTVTGTVNADSSTLSHLL